jgi:hypothetical protein
MYSRPRDEAGRFLPATNILNENSSHQFLSIPTPTSNPVENSRIARPVDDNFDSRLKANITRTLTPQAMFDHLMNRLDAFEARIIARYNSTSPARDLSSPPRHSESAYVDKRQHVDAKIQRDPIQHIAPTPEPTSTSAEPSPRRTESSETAAEDVCDISFGDPGTVSGEIAASKLAAATTPIPRGDMPILKTDEPKSTSADTSTRRTESSETAIKDIHPKKFGDISEFAATAPVAAEDITIPKIYDGIDGIDLSDSNARVDTADVARDALQILSRTPGTIFKVKHTFPCPIAHSDVDWGGSLSPSRYGYMVADSHTKSLAMDPFRKFRRQIGVS